MGLLTITGVTMKPVHLLFATFCSLIAFEVQADDRYRFRVGVTSLDTIIEIGDVTYERSGLGSQTAFSYFSPNYNVATFFSFDTQSGKTGVVDYSSSTYSVSLGYDILDANRVEEDLKTNFLLGLGYASSEGEITVSGAGLSWGNDSTIVFAQLTSELSDATSLYATSMTGTFGGTDSRFAVGVNFTLSDENAVTVGYSTHNTSSSNISTDTTGWTIGWKTSF
mgnify:FL=1|jgi:hypothetical protein